MKEYLKKLDKKSKIVLILTLAVFLAAILFFSVFSSLKKDVFLDFQNSAVTSEKLCSQKNGIYKFSTSQIELLKSFYKQNQEISLKIKFLLKDVNTKKMQKILQKKQDFYFGFLYEKDFSSRGKLNNDLSESVFARTDLRNFLLQKQENQPFNFEISLAIEKNLPLENLPCGFIVFSTLPSALLSAQFENARLGFDLTQNFPFFGVSSTGGFFANNDSIDFTGAKEVFHTENSSYYVMPQFLIQINGKSSSDNSEIKMNAGGEIIRIYRNVNDENYIFQSASLSNPFSRFEIDDFSAVRKLIMCANDKSLVPEYANRVLFPYKTDPGLLPLSKKSSWRISDYELYEWDRMKGILFFDFKDYYTQSLFLRRLAFFAEKAGYRGKILTDEELGDMHGYNAHDYSAQTLADFFTLAEKRPNVINQKELLLKDILLANGIIKQSLNKYEPGFGAIISISQESPEYLRRSLSAHEIWHGLYFTDEDFRNTTAAIYYTIDSRAIDFLVGYWTNQKTLMYDSQDLFLIKNEFMAYILQQPLSEVSKYFVRIANFISVTDTIPELAYYIRSTNARSLEDAAKVLDSYVSDRWGLSSGRVSMLVR